MNSVKIAYIISMTVSEIMFFLGAILTPIYVTPGWYFWTAFCIVLFFAVGHGGTKRMNSWNNFGTVD